MAEQIKRYVLHDTTRYLQYDTIAKSYKILDRLIKLRDLLK